MRRAGRHAARIRVLDDDAGRLGELERDAERRVEVEQVRVRQLLALMHLPRVRPESGVRLIHEAF